MTRLTLSVLAAAAALLAPAAALASPSPVAGGGPAACGATGAPLVNVQYTLVNDYDSATDGHAWANDTIDRHLRIWQTGPDTYCALVDDHGSFVTFAGTSPAGTGTVPAGVTGTIDGGYSTTQFTGVYDPTLATHGNLGTFDLMCTTASTCPGAHPSYASYFDATAGDTLADWGWTYHTARNGTWVNAASGNSGDITG